jgi:wobble nucleotide-excising tRNase
LDDCPFCEQPIKNPDGNFIDLIKNYETVFNEEFLSLQNRTKNNLSEYQKGLRLLLSNFYPTGNGNLLGRFNKTFEENKEFPSFSLTPDENMAIEKEIALVNEKLENLLKPTSTSNTPLLKDVFKKYNEFTNTYNNFIEEVNQMIFSQQEKIRTGEVQKEINEIEKRIAVIDAQTFSIAHVQEYKFIINQNAAITQNDSVLGNIDSILKTLRDKVNAEFDTFIVDYFAIIKRNIKKIYPNLDIVEFEKSRGTSYDFRNNEINCGFIVKYKGHDRFKDLSEGEKQVIALAYFFAMVEKEQNIGDKIIVFDDPITSFDAGKRRQTAELIFEETKKCKQTFILTCDPLFRQYSQKIIPAQKSYYMLKAASSSIFYTPKDVESVFNSFRKDLGDIHLAAGADEDIVTYGQKLRFCIEEVRETYLGHNTDGLSEVLTRVKSANFGTLVPKIDDLLAIYGYCNVGGLAHFPKDGSTTWVELKTQVNKYLGLPI